MDLPLQEQTEALKIAYGVQNNSILHCARTERDQGSRKSYEVAKQFTES